LAGDDQLHESGAKVESFRNEFFDDDPFSSRFEAAKSHSQKT